jgi:hypothetical protein
VYTITGTFELATGDVTLAVDGVIDNTVGSSDNEPTITTLPIWRVGAPPESWVTDFALFDSANVVPSDYFSDDFNRANGPPGSDWEIRTGSVNPTIVSNQLQATGNMLMRTSFDMPNPTDYGVEVDVNPTVDGTAVAARIGVGAHYTGVWYGGALNRYYIQRWTDVGNFAANLADSGIGPTTVNPQRIRLEVEGTALRLYSLDLGVWTLRVSTTDATLATGRPGLSTFIVSTTQYDNFLVTPL